MTINEIQDEIISDFELFDSWDDKYSYIIELGKTMPKLPETHKTDQNIVRGCQSLVWLHAHTQDNKLIFEGDSDAIIVKGLVSLLIKVLSGHQAQEITNSPLYFLEKIGLSQHLSMTRANGLASMVILMQKYAKEAGTR